MSGPYGRHNKVIDSAEERTKLLNFVKNNHLERIKVGSKQDLLTPKVVKAPANHYYYVKYEYSDVSKDPVSCTLYCQALNKYTNYLVPLDEDCTPTDEMLNWCNNKVLADAKHELRTGLSAIERKFGKRITQTKEESHSNGVSTNNMILLFKNPQFDGLEINHVTGVDATSAYSSYVVSHSLNWCTIPDELYETEELKQQINDEANQFFTDYMLEWFEKKKNAKTPEQKKKAKAMLNVIIGMLRNCNVWVWKQIVGGVKDMMLDLSHQVESTGEAQVIYANTDSIYYVGKTMVFDPLFGTNLGNFHIEHKDCRFRWREGVMAYQIDDEYPVWRGVPKQRFAKFEKENHRPFNLLTDETPKITYLGEIF